MHELTSNEVKEIKRVFDVTRKTDIWFVYGGQPIESLISIPKEHPIYVEVGANDGRTCSDFLVNFPSAQCFCFEPDPRNIQKILTRNYPETAKFYEVAVADYIGQATLSLSTSSKEYMEETGKKEHTDSSSILDTSITPGALELPWLEFNKTIKVDVVTLDSWLEFSNVSHVDFLWIDAEGASGLILKGGSKTLNVTKYINLECSDYELYGGEILTDDLLNMLSNWEVIECDPHNMLLGNKNLVTIDI